MRRPLPRLQCTPTTAPRPNQEESWLARVTPQQPHHGTCRSTPASWKDIEECLKVYSEDPIAFVLTKPANQIRESSKPDCTHVSDPGQNGFQPATPISWIALPASIGNRVSLALSSCVATPSGHIPWHGPTSLVLLPLPPALRVGTDRRTRRSQIPR